MEKTHEPKRPRGWARVFYRLPLKLYSFGLGSLLGERFIHLVHTGRVSGLRREVVLEVVEHVHAGDIYYVASGWGARSDWYLNILKDPKVAAQVGSRKFCAQAEPVAPALAAEVFSRYGQRHPRTLQTLARGMGYRIRPGDESYRALGRVIPVVGIRVERLLPGSAL
ncbi:MAG: nitroreductase family deazaflavin-dependent oxidoreductase [Anaerolineales bacterium]|nr:MAG: nitroreductase family deazaflavin-dependent oxidoreductase [Anaerolineales bacterium]